MHDTRKGRYSATTELLLRADPVARGDVINQGTEGSRVDRPVVDRPVADRPVADEAQVPRDVLLATVVPLTNEQLTAADRGGLQWPSS
ncbi:MAG: hypothetical protein H7201_11840 [Candidatus Saccharibacteria bacterium]|nr:hypothetical protein [Microbacteriaceae bacterium]